MGRKKNSDKVKEQSETQENIQLLVEDNNVEDNNVEDNNVEDNNVEELLPDSPISEPLTEINLESDLKPVESDLKPVSDLEPVESDLKPVESDLESDLEPVLDLKQYFKPIKVNQEIIFNQPLPVIKPEPIVQVKQPVKKQTFRRGATMPMFLGRR